mmetsp:Transcript_6627/g.21090  ORF Transcript_6627/g.21090 Transcript_6627/m.21090 type:complete len:224 (+) Transcript_6627:328-999(+)
MPPGSAHPPPPIRSAAAPPPRHEAKHGALTARATKAASRPDAAGRPGERAWLSCPSRAPASAQRRSTVTRARLPRASWPAAASHCRLSRVRRRAPSAVRLSKCVRKYQSGPPSPGGSSSVKTRSVASPRTLASSESEETRETDISAARLSQAQPSAGRMRRKRRCSSPPSTAAVQRTSKPAGCIPYSMVAASRYRSSTGMRVPSGLNSHCQPAHSPTFASAKS